MRSVFRNGVVYTMNHERPVAEGFVVEDGVIVSLDVQSFDDGEVMDLAGGTVLPGLIDSHTHFVSYCSDVLAGVDVSGCDSAGEAAEAVGDALRLGAPTRSGGWVVGGGWDKNRWSGDRFPRKDALDSVVGDRPVALYSRDCHALWVNTVALEEVGIVRDSEDPPGGEIRRGADGMPSGILLDAAMEPVRRAIPPPSEEQLFEAVREGIGLANSLGITGIVACEGRDAFRVLSSLAGEPTPALRTWITIPEDALEAAEKIGLGAGVGNAYFSLVGLKIMLDGSLGSQTAYLEEPYEDFGDGDYRGLLLKSGTQLGDLVERAAALGLPSFIHAIGDAACELAISTLERHGAGILGHRIEHAQLLRGDHPGRMARVGAIASVQPAHLGDDIPLVQRHWGERGSRAYALRDLVDAGVTLAFGSDVPVASMDPFAGIARASFRPDGEGGIWHAEQRISIPEALRAHTLGSAIGVGEQDRLGSISPGFEADFVVLRFDPTEARSFDELAECSVESTWVGGCEVYRRPGTVLFGRGVT